MLKKELGRDLFTCFEHLKEYNNSLMINEDVRSEDALRYLKENINYKSSTDMEKKLCVLFDDAVSAIECSIPVVSPGLQVLEQRLVDKLSGDGNKSKGIIFVKTRLVAFALLNWLRCSASLEGLVNNPSVVIGCGQRNGLGGMPKAKQDREIRNFRNGDSNIIVATSVLLEGIDVPDCNFVINYGMPGNEITFMQARGRVRSRETGHDSWQYEIIVPHDQATMKERDMEKEKLMKDALLKVINQNKEEFDKQLVEIQQKILEEYNKMSTKNPAKDVTDDVKLFCKKCDVFACKAKDIKKCYTSYIVPDYTENLPNASFEAIEGAPSTGRCPGFDMIGKTVCKNCGFNWGKRARSEHGDFPLLKIANFRVEIGTLNGRRLYKSGLTFPTNWRNLILLHSKTE
ncbi:interferon-induced helicase C domain-containing protein 1-like [Xenia sp. Carnegie-2017]|uniref:interferon-induced helicase C domain-containing protein 1-like n=1 Tax=Xenia sp. Carnegie-2017 TaxID=2897299 RepID=UPI001F04F050|nr:interferon-induced helicase C domain-containing protein 1-like [Xenia sp. Carnegie-2017]